MDVLAKLTEKLKEEQWTRSTIEKYSIKDLTTLEEMVNEIIKEHAENDAHQFCLDFITNSPKSITGLYILGILSYEIEDRKNSEAILQLVEIFKENKKWTIVETILHKILEYEENIYALTLLVSIYTNFKKEEEKLEVLKRLVKVDTENGDVAKQLAEKYEAESDKENSIKYYKSALRRFAKNKQYTLTESIWKKISSDVFEEINFFLNISTIISESNLDLAINLSSNLLEVLEVEDKIDEAIFVAKSILIHDSFNQKIKQKLIDLYKIKFQKNAQLDECIENSGLLNNKIKIEAAIKKFEKEILFAEGSYIYHKTWGIGNLKSITEDSFILDFDEKADHKMSYSMALKSLIPLNPDHIWVLKKEDKVGDINDSENMIRILLSILRSFPDKPLSIENFKEELVPNMITTTKWNSWWNKAKNILKQETSVKTIKEGRPKYLLRDIKVRFEEELVNGFFESKQFDEKLKIFEEFIKDSDSLEDFSDFFREMIHYFTEATESNRFDFNEKVISYVLLRRLRKSYGWAIGEVTTNVNNYMDLPKLIDVLNLNYKSDYKKDIITLIDKFYHDPKSGLEEVLWNDKGQLASYIMEKLEKRIDDIDLKLIIDQALNNKFKHNPFITIWFLQYLVNNREEINFNYELNDIYIEILYRVDTIGKLLNQKKLNWFNPALYTADAKKILSISNDFLFKTEDFKNFVLENEDSKYVDKLYHLIKSSTGLNSKKKNDLMKSILKKDPNIETTKSEEDFITHVTIDYFNEANIWTSMEGLDSQKQKVEDLRREKELNLIELNKAREKGDLRENAEYQAAKEKDTNFNNHIMELSKLITKAKIIDLNNVSGEEVTLGTTVTLERDGKKEIYTVLGYWDTNEKEHIIAYNSPLAKAIIGTKKGETIEIELGGELIKIKILSIKPMK